MSLIKRFVVFSGDRYYPSGGWRDYQASYDTLDAAAEAPITGDWCHIIDLTTGQVFKIPIHDAATAARIRCDECECGAPRVDGGVHVDSDRLGLHEDTPCRRVFVVRADPGWEAYVDGMPLREESGDARRYATATAAYAAARDAAPRRWHP